MPCHYINNKTRVEKILLKMENEPPIVLKEMIIKSITASIDSLNRLHWRIHQGNVLKPLDRNCLKIVVRHFSDVENEVAWCELALPEMFDEQQRLNEDLEIFLARSQVSPSGNEF